MASLQRRLALYVIAFILCVCHAQQTITQPTFIQKMQYNISSVAFTTSLLSKTTGSKNDACYLQCFVTPHCMSFIYNSDTTECHIFSALLEDPPHSTNSFKNAYFIQGSMICSEMGYIFEAAIPFCYKIHHDTVRYDNAVLNCQNEGGRLFQIDSLAKQKVAETFVLDTNVKKYWIEGEYVNNTWIFPSGLRIPRLYWDKGEPTLRGDRTSLTLYHKSNKWNDVTRGIISRGYICERML